MSGGRKVHREGAGKEPRPLVVNGYRLMAWTDFGTRWRKLRAEVKRLRSRNPEGYRGTPAAKLLAAVRNAVLHEIPMNSGHDRYRQGSTKGDAYSHWRRTSFFVRFRLFFRYSSKHKIIVYAWLNDESTLRKRGARTDPSVVFRKMLEAGRPPEDWDALVRACREWTDQDV